MQSPTPPTNPTPPPPPTMKTTTTTSLSGDPPTTTQWSTPSTTAGTSPSMDKTATPSSEPAAATIPPLGSYNSSSTGSRETTAETAMPAVTANAKKSPSSFGISILLFCIFAIAIALLALHFGKKNPNKKNSIVDYSTESSQEIIDLILSPNAAEPPVQSAAKKVIGKAKTESARKNKGNFEVRA